MHIHNTHIHTYIYMHMHTLYIIYIYAYIHTYIPVFLISSYGVQLAQKASYLALSSFLLGQMAQLIMIILSLTALTLS